ncbi:MAG: hypothetical protein PGN13_10265 [Patulibacter minatonensis]
MAATAAPDPLRTVDRSPLAARVLLALYVVVLVAASWKRWGDPVSDVGLDLTIAAHWADGLVPYRDVRYWYGPLGIGSLTAAFAVFGAQLWTAVALGLTITGAITELSRRLARRWLAPLPSLGVAAMVLSIAFGGSLFDFTMPHTFAATTGLLALLLVLLALSHERFALAGIAVGFAALARPEFLGFAIAAVGGAAFGVWRERGFPAALRSGLVAVGVGAVVAVPPYAWLASLAGTHRLLWENIWPVEFLRAVGGTFEHDQHPFDLPSIGTLLVRGAVLLAGTWIALRVLAVLLGRRRAGVEAPVGAGAGSAPGVWLQPTRVLGGLLALAVVGLAVAAVGGDAGEPLRLVEADLTRLLIAMTPLAAVGLAVLVWGAVAWLRHAVPPLQERADDGPGWVAAGALIATASACSLRSYGIFSTDVYASYYAPPVVVLVAILLVRLARRAGGAQPALAATVVLALGAASLSAHAVLGLYRDKSVPVSTPVGSFRAAEQGGAAVKGVLDALNRRVKPGDRLLALPQEPGFLFLTRTRPALYDATFLPGVLFDPEDDRAAARTLLDGSPTGPVPGYTPPRYVVEGVWNFKQWGFTAQGVDVNVALHRAITSRYRVIGRFGETDKIPEPYTLGHAFVLYELR